MPISTAVMASLVLLTANEKIECVARDDDDGDRGLKDQGL
jgi:hypothetical protein